jgi:hypothetical protein
MNTSFRYSLFTPKSTPKHLQKKGFKPIKSLHKAYIKPIKSPPTQSPKKTSSLRKSKFQKKEKSASKKPSFTNQVPLQFQSPLELPNTLLEFNCDCDWKLRLPLRLRLRLKIATAPSHYIPTYTGNTNVLGKSLSSIRLSSIISFIWNCHCDWDCDWKLITIFAPWSKKYSASVPPW